MAAEIVRPKRDYFMVKNWASEYINVWKQETRLPETFNKQTQFVFGYKMLQISDVRLM
jgi:hypothetical protein